MTECFFCTYPRCKSQRGGGGHEGQGQGRWWELIACLCWYRERREEGSRYKRRESRGSRGDYEDPITIKWNGASDNKGHKGESQRQLYCMNASIFPSCSAMYVVCVFCTTTTTSMLLYVYYVIYYYFIHAPNHHTAAGMVVVLSWWYRTTRETVLMSGSTIEFVES